MANILNALNFALTTLEKPQGRRVWCHISGCQNPAQGIFIDGLWETWPEADLADEEDIGLNHDIYCQDCADYMMNAATDSAETP